MNQVRVPSKAALKHALESRPSVMQLWLVLTIVFTKLVHRKIKCQTQAAQVIKLDCGTQTAFEHTSGVDFVN